MKILFDTNVLVSAFVTRGQTFELIKDAFYKHQVYCTDHILGELRQTLDEKFSSLSAHARDSAISAIEKHFIRGVTASKIKAVCRDPDDDQILADALINRLDLIITGDKDLLHLKNYEGIRILQPKDYWSIGI